jgi:hypothetical protein
MSALTALSPEQRNSLLNSVVTATEDPALFLALLDAHLNRYQPADLVERTYVEHMVAALWRLRRAEAAEVALLNRPDVDPLSDPRLDAARRHQARLLRNHQQAARAFAALRRNYPLPAKSPNEPKPAPAPAAAPPKPAIVPNEPKPPAPAPVAQPPAKPAAAPAPPLLLAYVPTTR